MNALDQKLIDTILAGQLDLQRYEAGVRARILGMLEKLRKELRVTLLSEDLTTLNKARTTALLKQSTAVIDHHYAQMQGTMEAAMTGAAQATMRQTAASLAAPMLLINVEVGLPTATFMGRLASNVLITGAPSAEWWGKQSGDTAFKFSNAVRQGVLAGETNEQIVSRVVGTKTSPGIMQAARHNARALVHSSIQAVSGAARRETYAQNRDVVKGIRQHSTFDGRTCWSTETLLLMADGTHRPIGDVAVGDLVIGGLTGVPCKVLAVEKSKQPSSVETCYNGNIIGRTTHDHRILTPAGWRTAADICILPNLSEREVLCRSFAGYSEAVQAAQNARGCGSDARGEQRNQEIRRAGMPGPGGNGFLPKSIRFGKVIYSNIEHKVSAWLQHDGWWRGDHRAFGGIESGFRQKIGSALRRPVVSGSGTASVCQSWPEGVRREQSILRDTRRKGVAEKEISVQLAGERSAGESRSCYAGIPAQIKLQREGVVERPCIQIESERSEGEASGGIESHGLDRQEVREARRHHAECVERPGISGENESAKETETTFARGGSAARGKSIKIMDTGNACCPWGENEIEVCGIENVSIGFITGEEKIGEVEIVSLSIEGDHSYVVGGGLIVHNSETCIAYNGQEWDIDTLEPLPGSHLPYDGGTPRHWNAVPRGTMIATTAGDVPIEQISVGDLVTTHKGRFMPVTATMRKPCDSGVIRVINTSSGGILKVTGEHPVLTAERGWIRADSVRRGDAFFQNPAKSEPVGHLSVVVGATDNYPPCFNESEVFTQVCVEPGVMLFPVKLNNYLVSDEGEVANIPAKNKLLRKGNAGVVENISEFAFPFWYIGKLFLLNSKGVIFNALRKCARIVGSHAGGMFGIHGVRLFCQAISPMVFTRHDTGCLQGRHGNCSSGALASDSDPMLFAPKGEDCFSKPALPLNHADGLPVDDVVGMNDGSNFGFASEIKHWQLSTVQDIRIVAYDGEVFNLSVAEDETYLADGFVVHNCRSAEVPVLYTLRELGLDVDDTPTGTRASSEGQIRADTTFEEFLGRRTEAQQDEQLGVGRAQLWRDGKLTLSQLLDLSGSPLSLTQLTAKYGG